MLSAVGWGALAASSLVLGAILGVARSWSDGLVGAVLGFGAGALISSVAFELAEEGLATSGPTEVAASVQVTLSQWAVGVRAWSNGRGDPKASSDFIGVGWEPFRRIWAHYFLANKRVRSIRIGAVGGPCGDLAKRIRQFPFRPVRPGQWSVYFSPSQFFDRRGAWIRYRVVVPRSKAVPAVR